MNYKFTLLLSTLLIVSLAHSGHNLEFEDYKDLFFDESPLIGPNNKIRVHMVCHSHEDTGWLKTVDECYYGANNQV